MEEITSWSELDEVRAQKAIELAEHYNKIAEERLAQDQKSYALQNLLNNFDPKEWNRAEFVDRLHHFAHHNRLDDKQKLMSLRMLIDKEYGNVFGGEKK